MSDEYLWVGSFWNRLIYPESCIIETHTPEVSISWVWRHIMNGEFPDYVVAMCLDDYSTTRDDEQDVLTRTEQRIIEVMPSKYRKLLGFTHYNMYYFCGTLDSVQEASRKDLLDKLDTLLSFLLEDDCVSITIGVCFVSEKSLKGWREAAQYALVAQRTKVREGPCRIYVYSNEFLSKLSIGVYGDIMEELWNLVRTGDISAVERIFGSVCHRVFEENYIPLLDLRVLLQLQVMVMGWTAIQVGVDSSIVFKQIQDYLWEVSILYDYVKLRNLMSRVVSDFTAKVYTHYANTSNELIMKAEEFIDNHFKDFLSLKSISDALCVNPSYLSRRFKSEKGIGIAKYIAQKRIQHAKCLLLDKRLSISQIAFDSGFGTIQSFARTFRDHENCTPSEYRESKIVTKK